MVKKLHGEDSEVIYPDLDWIEYLLFEKRDNNE